MGNTTQKLEKKVVVMRRYPPGDRWTIPPDSLTIFNSLTEAMEEYFQRTGVTEFFVSAKDGTVSVLVEEDVVIEKPIQKYSLYGEN